MQNLTIDLSEAPSNRRKQRHIARRHTRTRFPQVKKHLFLREQIIAAPHLHEAAEPRRHHGAIVPAGNTLLKLGTESWAFRTRSDKRHPFCQDEKTLKAPTGWIIGLTCRFLYCQRHCGQRVAPANRSYRFAHNKKTTDDNSKGRVEPEDGLSPLSRIVPLGRIPNGTILRRRHAAT